MVRFRPRFSVRTLAIVITLACAYFGAWEATKRYGVRQDKWLAGSPMPFVVAVRTDENEIEYRLDYYLWFFGARTESPVYSSHGSAPLNVGIELKLESGSLVVMDVIPGGPADINGLTRGDRIVAVNERTLRGVSTEDVAEMLKGSDGSAVNFVVFDRNGDRREIRIVRRPLSATLLQNYRR